MLSPDQLTALLAIFEQIDGANVGSVPAGVVSAALRQANILPSSQEDEALLLLLVDADTGRVDYSRLRDEVGLASKQTRGNPVQRISQQDLVFKRISELREIFNKFDIGGISLQGFRDALERLGFKETQATKELFRHSYEMTFHQLVQSLTRLDDKDITAPPADVASTRRGPPRRGIFDEERSNEQKQSGKGMSAGKPLFSTTAPLLPHRHPDPHVKNENIFSGDGSQPRATEVFMTTTQSSMSPVRGKTLPQTSAGCDETRDNGLLRQQVHAAIRRLDAGEFDSRSFGRKLSELGVTPPENARRLLERYNGGAQVPFKDWVKAFEPFFEEKTYHDLSAKQLQGFLSNQKPLEEAGDDVTRMVRGQYGQRTSSSIFGGHVYEKEDDSKMSRGQSSARERQQRASVGNILVPGTDQAPIQAELEARQRVVARGHPANYAPKPDFLCWSEQDHTRPPADDKKPLRGVVGGPTFSSKPPPFAREGDGYRSGSVSGIPRSPEKRDSRRVPFGTEADYAASFANGVGPAFG